MKAAYQSIMVFTTETTSAQYQFADALMQGHIETGDITEEEYTHNWKSFVKQDGEYSEIKSQIFFVPLINSLPPIYMKPNAKMSIIGHGDKEHPSIFIGSSEVYWSPAVLAKQVVGWLTNSDGKIARIASITLCMCWGAGKAKYDAEGDVEYLYWMTNPKQSFAYAFAGYLGQVTPLVVSFTMKLAAGFNNGTGIRATGIIEKVQVNKGIDKKSGKVKIKFRVNEKSTLNNPLPPSFDDPLSNSTSK
jgi:hypothetical protein